MGKNLVSSNSKFACHPPLCYRSFHRASSCWLGPRRDESMRTFNIIVERDPDTGTYVGSVPGWPGAHSQGDTLDELEQNLHEVLLMLLEDGEPKLESEFVGLQTIRVA